MRKATHLVGVSAIALGMFIACKKDGSMTTPANPTITSAAQEKTISSDSYLHSVIIDNTMDQYDKAAILLNEDQLSESICGEIIQYKFDPYIVEVVIASQLSLSDAVLTKVIDRPSLNDATVLSILRAHSPLSSVVKNKLSTVRPGIALSDITAYNVYSKMVSMCLQGIIYGKNLVVTKISGASTYTMKDIQTIPFANTATSANVDKMIAGCGGTWQCGDALVRDKGDGITVISCTWSPKKCIKLAKQPSTLSTGDQSVVNTLDDPSLTSFEKGSVVLNLSTDISEALMSQIIDRRTNLDAFVYESILLSNGRISDDNLAKMAVDETIPDALLKNILIMNAPLSSSTKTWLAKFHPSIPLTTIADFDNSKIVFSICAKAMLCGTAISESQPSASTHEFDITNLTTIPLSTTASDPDIDKMIAGCGTRWICGELTLVSGAGTSVAKYWCVAPPNQKCARIAKN